MTRTRTSTTRTPRSGSSAGTTSTSSRSAPPSRQRRDALLGADDALRLLGELITDLQSQVQDATEVKVRSQGTFEELEGRWKKLSTRKDACVDALMPYEFDDAYQLTAAQQDDLDAVYADVTQDAPDEDAITEANRFTERTAVMQRILKAKLVDANKVVTDRGDELARTFAQFRTRWPDANLGAGVESYPDYLAIFEELERSGLHSTRAEWQHKITQWSAQDLVHLNHALSNEVAAIKARVAPINDILATLPFGARQGRLKLKVDTVSIESVRQFRIELKAVSSVATRPMPFEELRSAFRRLAAVMDQLRAPGTPGYNPDRSTRALVLDVRRHVEVYAVEYPYGNDTWKPTEHRQIGSASGGESQELIAFILGSALRFRLGDELRARPRFAPVFLDEGFVKADSQFAGRAVSAWRGLGFQIVVGSPEDKFTGLERHMNEFVVVSKDPATGYSRIDRMSDHERDERDERDARGGPEGDEDGAR